MGYEFTGPGNYGGLGRVWGFGVAPLQQMSMPLVDRAREATRRVAEAVRRPRPKPRPKLRPKARPKPRPQPQPEKPVIVETPKLPPVVITEPPPSTTSPVAPPAEPPVIIESPVKPPELTPEQATPSPDVEEVPTPAAPEESSELEKLTNQGVIPTINTDESLMPQMQYILDPLTGQYIPAAPGAVGVPGAPIVSAPAGPGAIQRRPAMVNTGIRLPSGVRLQPGMTRGMPRGPLPKPIVTPQQARLGTITAALAAGLMFL